MMHKTLGLVVGVIAAIGAINWGLVALFNFDLVMYIFGGMPVVAKAIYVIVGISGVLLLFTCKCMHKNCNKSSSCGM